MPLWPTGSPQQLHPSPPHRPAAEVHTDRHPTALTTLHPSLPPLPMDIRIAELSRHPEQLNKETLLGLRELVAKYPYYQTARILLLRNLFLLHDAQFGEELRRAAFYLPDRKILFQMVEADNYEIKPAPQPLRPRPAGVSRTVSLIDDFLRTADEPTTAPRRKPTAADATTDYAAFLLEMDDADTGEATDATHAPNRSVQLIDGYMESSPSRPQLREEPTFKPEIEAEEEETDTVNDDGYLTMTLAKIYIKQQRYEKALEIIRKVSLNNPKKSAYFADQIRFLQKLIINNKYQKQ